MRIGNINSISQCYRKVKSNINHAIIDKLKGVCNQSVEFFFADEHSKQEGVKSSITLLCSEIKKRIDNSNIYYYEDKEVNANIVPGIRVVPGISAKELQNLNAVSDARLYKHLIQSLYMNDCNMEFFDIYDSKTAEQYNIHQLDKYAGKNDFITILDTLAYLYLSLEGDFYDNKFIVWKDMEYVFEKNNFFIDKSSQYPETRAKEYEKYKNEIHYMIHDVLEKWPTISDMLANNRKSVHYHLDDLMLRVNTTR